MLNPFRYRSYYYDVETGLYYVKSRYYDPVVGRWISPDGVMGLNQDMSTYNLFAYCGNNPIIRVDINGNSWIALAIIIVCTVAFGVVGATSNKKSSFIGTEPKANTNNTQNQKPIAPTSPKPDMPLSKPGLPPPKAPDSEFSPKPDEEFMPNVPPSYLEPFPSEIVVEENPANTEPLTVGDRVSNTLQGMATGLLVGGGIVAIAGVFALSAPIFAIGALAFNAATIFLPFFGIEIDPIEFENN